MAHTNEIIINGASSRSMQSQCGSYQIVGAGEERKMDEKKSTQRSSFFTKRTAMLFFVLACIFLKHQDYAPRQGVSTLLQVRNKVGRNLRTNDENAPIEEEEEEEFGESQKYYVEEEIQKPSEVRKANKDSVRTARMDDKNYLSTLQESYDEMDNDDKEEQKKKEKKIKEKKKETLQEKFRKWEESKRWKELLEEGKKLLNDKFLLKEKFLLNEN
ncbi:Plasmodium exported protein, unknown function [Plasmodium knowlesi strain H]|uniref:Uncharacterized protein n=3 Tax=Plasmodium knowlesi TaxID=5850 RepID=A0A5E7X7E5_PLAKH|nr:Plasmodium exported protein, unknown function [Plasmodium knowlesi strain H]OTN65583.1 Uncharacterized protein PKNOH_S110117800 [Plasmodium knowlesi]CAA9989794.1 Plasmodium exported protein, unknown function [Plasmodium knowlesi strain H]SBO22904.1 Plasmodium exported protein, unknown function [Plasmodium knowlesi strain H]SBO22993.1 Plasmodium exported protein, unknown function [Plasmodium knowlesi strain H]VVS79268.1 Plasmodium exported protein, unknown function [Plasmodium knowlesi strai